MIYLLPFLSSFLIFWLICSVKFLHSSPLNSSRENIASISAFASAVLSSLVTVFTFVEFPEILYSICYLPCLLPLYFSEVVAKFDIKQKLREYLEIDDE